MQSTKEVYDVIVAGSAQGGATVAGEMSAQGKKVQILEWGNNINS